MSQSSFEGPDVFSVFWIVRVDRSGSAGRTDVTSLADSLQSQPGVRLRGAYSLAGIRPDADAIFWIHGHDLDAIQATWTAAGRTPLGRSLAPVNMYIGLATPSRYVADHVPAFVRGIAAAKYLSVYPFVKTHEWYLLPFEERRRLMAEHGELGREFPGILTNTVSSFGLADQEFVVAIEGDDPGEIMRMMQRLRAAEVRKYTAYDTPIYLGRRLELDELLGQLAERAS